MVLDFSLQRNVLNIPVQDKIYALVIICLHRAWYVRNVFSPEIFNDTLIGFPTIAAMQSIKNRRKKYFTTFQENFAITEVSKHPVSENIFCHSETLQKIEPLFLWT